MNTIGIIAEYNPFHNGHAYQIQTIRQVTGAKNIVVVMSGNFVQRGAPAWTDKYLRAEMALENGADFIFELPTVFSTASAETFAYGGVSLLNSLGFVDGICFGSECGDLSVLSRIASFLAKTDTRFLADLSQSMKEGQTFPAARARLLQEQFSDLLTDYPGLLAEPNNILGIEYLKALETLSSPMIPFTVSRNDEGYHNLNSDGTFISATAIRNRYEQTEHSSFFRDLAASIPDSVGQLLIKNKNRFPVTENDFSEMIYYKLRTLDESALEIADMSPELLHRIQKNIHQFTTVTEFTKLLKTKQYTYSRISRVLFHLLFGIRRFSEPPFQTAYARLLGFRKDKSYLLRSVSAIPLITKMADADASLNHFCDSLSCSGAAKQNYLEHAHYQLDRDILASDLYRFALHKKNSVLLPDEYHAGVVIR